MTLAGGYFMNLFLGWLGPNEKVTDMGLAITKLPADWHIRSMYIPLGRGLVEYSNGESLVMNYANGRNLVINIPLVSEYAIDSGEYV
jgi:hypothetical protein